MRTIYEHAEEVLVWLGLYIGSCYGFSVGEADLGSTLLKDLYRHRNSDENINAIHRDRSRFKSLQTLMDLLRMESSLRL